MEGIYEITIIGRGGQGSKTASEVIAGAALRLGKYIQAFSEYGAERSGAPMTSYVRLSDNPITIHTQIINPNVIIIMDDSLIDMARQCDSQNIVVNTSHSPADIRNHLNTSKGRIFCIDSTGISIQVLGINVPNGPTVGAVLKVMGILPKDSVEKELRDKLEKKIGKEAMDKNILCLNRGYTEIREG
jgi:pyruvate ferredoxin oxidoreductase gamma subunit